MNKKIRNSSLMKNPYTIIIGDKEKEKRLISYKTLGSDENREIRIDEFILQIKEENKQR